MDVATLGQAAGGGRFVDVTVPGTAGIVAAVSGLPFINRIPATAVKWGVYLVGAAGLYYLVTGRKLWKRR